MQHAELITTLYKIGAIQFGEFTLKSGQQSHLYINLRKIISYPALLKSIAEMMYEKVKSEKFDLVCGVPYTALPIATSLSIDQNIPMIIRRKEKKDYGTKQIIEGIFEAGQIALIIEDVITTGGSIIETANDLQSAGIVINDVVVLIDREQGARENLEKQFNVHTILNLSDILNFLSVSDLLNATEKNYLALFNQTRSATC